MNITPLKKGIAKESAIFAIMVGVAAAILIAISLLHDDYVLEKGKEASVAANLLANKQSLENKLTKLNDNLELYRQLQSHAAGVGLILNEDAIRAILGKYQNQFLFGKLSVEASSIADIKDDPKYVRPNFVVTRSSVKLTIEALSDEDIYQLLRALGKELPGFIKITSLKLTKKHTLSKEVISTIQKSGAYSLVEGECDFDWYGLKSTKVDDPFNQYKPKAREGSSP